jgi:hypothetical protein
MRIPPAAVLAVALVLSAEPVLGQVKLLDLVSDKNGQARSEQAPAEERFAASPDVKDASSGSLKLTGRSLPSETPGAFWVRATVTGGSGDDLRSVEYRFRHAGRDIAETVTDKPSGFALVGMLSEPPEIEARVSVASGSGGPTRVVSLKATVVRPVPALPPGVSFSVNAREWTMPGGARSRRDLVKLQLLGDASGLRQIAKVEYTVDDSVKEGDARRGFYLESMMPVDKWPIATQITWKDGRVTRTNLNRQ